MPILYSVNSNYIVDAQIWFVVKQICNHFPEACHGIGSRRHAAGGLDWRLATLTAYPMDVNRPGAYAVGLAAPAGTKYGCTLWRIPS